MVLHELYEEVNQFINDSNKIYLYGAGHYGKFMLEYVRQWKNVSGFIESEKIIDNKYGAPVYSASEIVMNLKKDDAIILSMSDKTQNEVLNGPLSNATCRILALDSWKLYELCQFGTYQARWEEVKDIRIGKDDWAEKTVDKGEKYENKRKLLLEQQKKYGFADWHVNTDNAYGDDVASFIERLIKDIKNPLVVECGCGLCNIIGNISSDECRKIAIDREEAVLAVDKDVYGDQIDFRLGSFEQIGEKHIDVLITVNFVNSIPPEEVNKIFSNIFHNSYIKYYIVDEVTGNYLNHYRFKDLLPSCYKLSASLGPYGADGGVRYIRVFEHE